MREIGSEFWNVPTVNRDAGIVPDSAQWYLSGRSALQAVIRDLKDCRTVSMPSWCCDSMVKPFLQAGMDVRFYPVYFKGGLVQDIRFDADVLFLMDYFGYTSDAHEMSSYNGIVIRDMTHSIFSAAYQDADYYFGSLRKWCGVWTGGYAWARDHHRLVMEPNGDDGYAALREAAMLRKAEYINGQRTDKEYLKMLNQAEEALEKVGIAPACDRDIALARKLDVEFIRSRRRANAEVLRAAFPELLIFRGQRAPDCPLFVPILVPDGKRDALRRYLIDNEIYCPVHWPVSEYHRLHEEEKYIYDNELSLVCDQRYIEEDMNRMAGVIKRFWKEA